MLAHNADCGSTQLGNKVYKLSTPDGELVLIPISAATAIKSLPKNTFEFQAASNEVC